MESDPVSNHTSDYEITTLQAESLTLGESRVRNHKRDYRPTSDNTKYYSFRGFIVKNVIERFELNSANCPITCFND